MIFTRFNDAIGPKQEVTFFIYFFMNDFNLDFFTLEFAKDTGKYIKEKMVKVILISPPSKEDGVMEVMQRT